MGSSGSRRGMPVIRDRRRVAPGNVLQSGQGPPPHLGVGLAAFNGKFVLVVHEGVGQLRLVMDHVPEKQGLPAAHMDLPQLVRGVQGQIVIAGHGGGGHPCAVQVAGVDRVNLLTAQPLSQGVDLLQTQVRHVSVPVALHHPIPIALGLYVPNEINFRHKSASES